MTYVAPNILWLATAQRSRYSGAPAWRGRVLVLPLKGNVHGSDHGSMTRGTYRGVYSSLFEDPDYQVLSPEARLCLLTARQCRQAGPAAIFVCYPAVLASQTGLTNDKVDAALSELETAGWIVREGLVLWVKNGLRYDPSMRLADKKHRRAVERAVSELPKLKIVLTFCDYYGITRPFEAPSKTCRTLALLKPDPEPEFRSLKPEPRRLTSSEAPQNGASAGSKAWEGYCTAYRRRYGVDPVRNAKINGQLANFVRRVPAAEAPLIAAFYVESNTADYVRAGHSIDRLLFNAEKLRTEWATGRRITETAARQGDRTENMGQIARDLIAKHSQERDA